MYGWLGLVLHPTLSLYQPAQPLVRPQASRGMGWLVAVADGLLEAAGLLAC